MEDKRILSLDDSCVEACSTRKELLRVDRWQWILTSNVRFTQVLRFCCLVCKPIGGEKKHPNGRKCLEHSRIWLDIHSYQQETCTEMWRIQNILKTLFPQKRQNIWHQNDYNYLNDLWDCSCLKCPQLPCLRFQTINQRSISCSVTLFDSCDCDHMTITTWQQHNM